MYKLVITGRWNFEEITIFLPVIPCVGDILKIADIEYTIRARRFVYGDNFELLEIRLWKG